MSQYQPKVSALMGAYNYGRYIVEAIESAMGQDYQPEKLELVVVDDGSTDNTPELVAECIERHPGRIKYVKQENAGATAATNRARREADGDLIALLDADDVWLPDKTRRQVEMLSQRPELGLVFSRMRLVDASGATLQNHYGYRGPVPENGFARVLWENIAVQSSLIIEAELFGQIPPEAVYADWWLTLVAAQHKKVDYLTDELVLYRWHGANITGGASGARALREAQKGIDFQRWVVRTFELPELTARLSPTEMAYVLTGMENEARKGVIGLKSFFAELTAVTDADREDAALNAQAAELALAEGDLQNGCALLMRACACDPYDTDLRARLAVAVTDSEAALQLPDPLEGHTGFTILTDAAFLLADDEHLIRYAEAMRPAPGAALVIDATELEPGSAGAALHALVARCGLADDDLLLIGLIGDLHPHQSFLVRSAVQARYAHEPETGGQPRLASAAVQTFTPDTLAELRDLAIGSGPGSLASSLAVV